MNKYLMLVVELMGLAQLSMDKCWDLMVVEEHCGVFGLLILDDAFFDDYLVVDLVKVEIVVVEMPLVD